MADSVKAVKWPMMLDSLELGGDYSHDIGCSDLTVWTAEPEEPHLCLGSGSVVAKLPPDEVRALREFCDRWLKLHSAKGS